MYASAGLFFVILPIASKLFSPSLSIPTDQVFEGISVLAGGVAIGYGLRKGAESGGSASARGGFLERSTRFSRLAGEVLFLVFVPGAAIAIWSSPSGFDWAAQNAAGLGLEYLVFLAVGLLAGSSLVELSMKWRVALLYAASMVSGMFGIFVTQVKPAFYPIFSYDAAVQLGTDLLIFGALGVAFSSALLVIALDFI